MSHFYSSIWGGRGEATRCGHKTTGINALTKNWHGKVSIKGDWRPTMGIDGSDVFSICLEPALDTIIKNAPTSAGMVSPVQLVYDYNDHSWDIHHYVTPGSKHNVTAAQAELLFDKQY